MTTDFKDRMLYGKQAIADFIGKSYCATDHLIRLGQVPAGKIGGKFVGDRELIRERMLEIASGKAQAEGSD
jgi:hypothetical protein